MRQLIRSSVLFLSVSWFLASYAHTSCPDSFKSEEIRLAYPQAYVGNQIDREKMAEWVRRQPPDAKAAAQLVADNLRVVSIQEFQDSLYREFDTMLSQTSPDTEIVVVKLKGSSNQWTTDYILKAFAHKNLLSVEFDELDLFVAKSLKAGKELKKFRFTLIDDAIYTGTQIANYMRSAQLNILDAQAFGANFNIHDVQFVAVIPYHMTKARLYTEQNPELKVNMKLYSSNHMPSFIEVDKYGVAKNIFSKSTVFFQHKVSDGFGFDEKVRDGYIHGLKPIPFIIERDPPYRIPALER